MITQILSYAGGPTGPFARVLAENCFAVFACRPGERVSADLSGRTKLRLMPSGVFFPTVENFIPAGSPFDLDAWMQDSRALSAKGYGPVKLHVDAACVPERDRETVSPFLEQVEPGSWVGGGDILIEGEKRLGLVPDRIICVLDQSRLGDPCLPAYLEAHGVTCLAVYGAVEAPQVLPCPLWGWTEKKRPLKVLFP